MRHQIRLVAVLLFSAISMSGSFGQASGKASDALLAADAAWMKVYAAKDLAGCGKMDDVTLILSPVRDFMTQRRALAAYAGGQKILLRASGNTSTLAYVA